jgi:hypothetical protein
VPLGCERHTAAIYDRGGFTRVGIIDPLTSVTWSRVRDDISTASFTTTAPTMECLKMLDNVEPGRHELVIFRGSARVWEGPITLIQDSPDSVAIEAKDVMHYAYRTAMHAQYNNNNPNTTSVVLRARNILIAELARKEALVPPINVVPYIQLFSKSDDARTSRKSLAFASSVYQDIDNMASRAGLDYTVIGRRILLFDTHRKIGQTPVVTEKDFIGPILASTYGMELATRAYTNDGAGHAGVAGGIDAYYGEWEIVDTAYDEEQTTAPTPTELTSQAVRNLKGRKPTPMVIRVPDGTRLNPNGVLNIDDLVPGVWIPLQANLLRRNATQMQKLNRLLVTETATEGEQISVTLGNINTDDEPAA